MINLKDIEIRVYPRPDYNDYRASLIIHALYSQANLGQISYKAELDKEIRRHLKATIHNKIYGEIGPLWAHLRSIALSHPHAPILIIEELSNKISPILYPPSYD